VIGREALSSEVMSFERVSLKKEGIKMKFIVLIQMILYQKYSEKITGVKQALQYLSY